MKRVTITPTSEASRRTKNRIKEHGPCFVMERSGEAFLIASLCWRYWRQAGLCWLLRAEDGWLGWLPVSEFDIVTCNKLYAVDHRGRPHKKRN